MSYIAFAVAHRGNDTGAAVGNLEEWETPRMNDAQGNNNLAVLIFPQASL